MADFFPTREAELLEWFKNFSATLAKNIPADMASGLTAKASAYERIYEKAKGENSTKALILKKNEKQDALKSGLRNIKNKYIDYNDRVTDPDRERLGLPVRDRIPTSKPKPVSRLTLEVLPINNRQHTTTAINQGQQKDEAPRRLVGSIGVGNSRYCAGELRHSVFLRRTTEVFNYRKTGVRKFSTQLVMKTLKVRRAGRRVYDGGD
ncbi:MAG: hypothetical protein LBB80_10280 [Treponema sp.]|jgi:hypothetical protein|nr:hypothetical protein [Treponema sp.]